MPIAIVLPITATVPGLPVIPITQPPTPIPEAWSGLQYWLTPDWDGAWQTGQYSAGHADPLLQSKWYILLNDAAQRLGALGPRGDSLARRLSTFDIAFWFGLGTAAADTVNGRKTLIPGQGGSVVWLSNEPQETEKQTALSSSAYTIALVFRADNGVKGGLIGNGPETVAENNSGVGWRFGWPDAGDSGTTLWQHSYNDSWLMPVDTATGQPVLVILTGNGANCTAYIKTGGVESNLTRTFSGARRSGLRVTMGTVSAVSSGFGNRKIALAAGWSVQKSGDELAEIKASLIDTYGPF